MCPWPTSAPHHAFYQFFAASLPRAFPVPAPSTLTHAQTIRFKSELVRNITIKLGYANAKIYRSTGPPPHAYESRGSAHPDTWSREDGTRFELVRHVSFVGESLHDALPCSHSQSQSRVDCQLPCVPQAGSWRPVA